MLLLQMNNASRKFKKPNGWRSVFLRWALRVRAAAVAAKSLKQKQAAGSAAGEKTVVDVPSAAKALPLYTALLQLTVQ